MFNNNYKKVIVYFPLYEKLKHKFLIEYKLSLGLAIPTSAFISKSFIFFSYYFFFIIY